MSIKEEIEKLQEELALMPTEESVREDIKRTQESGKKARERKNLKVARPKGEKRNCFGLELDYSKDRKNCRVILHGDSRISRFSLNQDGAREVIDFLNQFLKDKKDVK